MRAAAIWMCFWPGLPRLWRDGHGWSLANAFVFAVLLNLACVTTWIWPGYFGPTTLVLLWFTTVAVWGVSAWNSHQWMVQSQRLSKRPGLEELFSLAQSEYLKGHWPETEVALRQLLEQDSGDVDAHLMLATLFRRTNRREDANRQLDLLERLERSCKWRLEILQERRMLQRKAEEVPTH